MYPITPSIEPGESLAGYLFRIKEDNGFATSRWVARDAGMFHCGAQPTEHILERLSEMTGQDLEKLRQASNQSSKKEGVAKVAGYVLHYSSVVHYYSRYCPACSHDGLFHQQIWNISAIDCCPLHRMTLVQSCPEPKCGQALRWERPSFLKCSEGHNLVMAAGRMGELSDDRIFLSKLIYEKFGFNLGWAPILPKLSPEIAALDPQSLIDQAHLLNGIFDRHEPASVDGKKACKKGPDLWSTALLLQDWPRYFHARLKETLGESVSGGDVFLDLPHKNRLKSRLIYRAIAPTDVVLAELKRGLTKNGVHSEATWLSDGIDKIGLRTAANKMTMKFSKFRRVLEEAGCKIYNAPTGKRAYMSVQEFEDLRQQMDRRRRIAEHRIRDALGTAEPIVRQLIQSGVFGAEAAARKGVDLNEHTRVFEDELEGFKDKVRLLLKQHSSSGNALTYGGLRMNFHIRSLTVIDVIAAFLEGRLRAVSGSPDRLTTIRFDRCDLIELARQKEGELVPKIRKSQSTMKKAA